MEALPNGNNLPTKEGASLLGKDHKKYRAFAVFLICCAVLIAAFAISAICMNAENGEFPFWNTTDQTDDAQPSETTGDGSLDRDPQESTSSSLPQEKPPSPPLPDGAIPILKSDLLGSGNLLNETPYRPNISALLNLSLKEPHIGNEPLVLILHTHTSEAYLTSESEYFDSQVGDHTYSENAERNVLKVGEILSQSLNEQGIPTIHCKTLHDQRGLSGSYERSAESVKWYLEQYPSIRYVIDLHRDAVMTSNGEYVRSLASGAEENTAQVMAVVGSDCNGTNVPNMEENLALALQLCQRLNADGSTVSRAPFLKTASYNQELAPRSLILEIGTGANTVEEACRAAELVGKALAQLIKGE